jgi:hypothetical protein
VVVHSCLLGCTAVRQYNPEDSSEHHTCRRDNLKSHGRVVIVLKLVFANQYSYFAENKSLVIKTLSVEKFHCEFVKFV